MSRYSKVIYTVDFSFVNSLWLLKKYAVRALRWRVFLLLLWCVVSCLPASCSLRDHKNEHWLERTSGGSQSIPTATAIPSIQHFWCAPWEEGKLPTKSVETWAVVSWLDCWAGILKEKISQRRQGSTRSWQWVVYVNLCRLPPQTGWTQPLQTWFFSDAHLWFFRPFNELRIISAVLFVNVLFLAAQLQFEGSRVGENSDLESHSIFMSANNLQLALAFKLFQAFDSKVSWIL